MRFLSLPSVLVLVLSSLPKSTWASSSDSIADTIPKCAQPCIVEAQKSVTCFLTDSTCLCSNLSVLESNSDVVNCFTTSCTDASALIGLVDALEAACNSDTLSSTSIPSLSSLQTSHTTLSPASSTASQKTSSKTASSTINSSTSGPTGGGSTSTNDSTSSITTSTGDGLSTGAKAGIGVAAGLGGILLLIGAAVVIYRAGRRSARQSVEGSSPLAPGDMPTREGSAMNAGIRSQGFSGSVGAVAYGGDQAQSWNGEHMRAHDVMAGWRKNR